MTGSELQDLLDRVRRGDLDPSTAAGRILTRLATRAKATEICNV